MIPQSMSYIYILTLLVCSPVIVQSIITNTNRNTWKYRGLHDIHTVVQNPTTKNNFSFPSFPQSILNLNSSLKKSKPLVAVLVHGFGCSSTYWRATAESLIQEGYEVHAIDLLGQGQSAKPGRAEGVEYSISLWADLVDSYIYENIPDSKDIVLVGNSLGSLIALSAFTGDFVQDVNGNENENATIDISSRGNLKDRVNGICMFNCGVGLNSRGIANEPQWSPLQRFLINSLYDVLTLVIFNNQILLRYVLADVVTKDLLRETLQSLYKCNPDRVDDELVDSFFLPAKDYGALEALSQIYCNDPGRTPVEMHRQYADNLKNLPICLIWGDDDAVTPLQGGIGQFYTKMAQNKNNNVSFQVVEGGHVPFDDNPDVSNNYLTNWIQTDVVS